MKILPAIDRTCLHPRSLTNTSRDCPVAWRLTILLCLGLLLGSASALPASAGAAVGDTPSATSLPSWGAFTDELRQLGDKTLARLPERLRANPQIQREAERLLLEAIAARTIEAISADPDHPVFLPSLNVTLNVFQPNADTTYKTALIAPGGSYRLRGERGTVRLFKLGQFSSVNAKPGLATSAIAYHDFSDLHLDAQGRFDVILSPQRPEGYSGDWWQLDPRTASLVLRQVAFDWATERDPRISIERLDRPAQRPRPPAEELERRLRELGPAISNTALFLIDHVEGLRRDGYLNRLHEFDVSKLGGLTGQFYYEGAYELKPDEALILEAKVPDHCDYWSSILTNDIYETTDWYNNQSSLNGAQARVDHDGVFRAVISGSDPGVPNWLDTAGYASGAIQGRWMNCSATPIPSLRKVALAQVRSYLPAETPTINPADRDKQIRDRRAQVQQRPLW